MKKIFSLVILFAVFQLNAQSDTIVLNDIIVADQRINLQTKTQFVLNLKDSVISKNSHSLTSLFNFNTPIYFKENGLGMASSPSFRGTTAGQTAVLWNGISSNSRFLGQFDFNTDSGFNYDEIAVKPGGGSVIYGSGAIGGSIHLRNKINFNQGLNADILTKFGSYNTLGLSGKIGYSNENLSYNLGFSRFSSDNDFEIKSRNYINRNANYWRNSWDGNLAYRINQNNEIAAFFQFYNDQRHFSILEESAQKTKYKNKNFKSLLQWENQWNQLNSQLKIAYLKENYEYFHDLEQASESFGTLNTFITKYDGKYQFNNNLNVSFLAEYTLDQSQGDANSISDAKRNILNFAGLISHQIFEKFYYEAGIRTEISDDFNSPLLFSMGLNYQPKSFYETKFNISKNYKSPTFNDLYWEPGGDLTLSAENSLQFEWGHRLNWKKNQLGVNLYYNEIQDMIRWMPYQGHIWAPMNTDEVISKGIETFANFQHSVGNHHFQLNATYAYTLSRNKATEMQLSYVPFHNANWNFQHTYKNYAWFLQGMYVGDVFSTEDESDLLKIDSYQVWNAGIHYEFGQNYRFNVGFHVNNVFNYFYQPMLYRPMPMRNYGIQLRFSF